MNYANIKLENLKQLALTEVIEISNFFGGLIYAGHTYQRADHGMPAVVNRGNMNTLSETMISFELLPQHNITQPGQYEDRSGGTPPTAPRRREATPTPPPSPIFLTSAQPSPAGKPGTLFAGTKNNINPSSPHRHPPKGTFEAPPPPTLAF